MNTNRVTEAGYLNWQTRSLKPSGTHTRTYPVPLLNYIHALSRLDLAISLIYV